MQRFFRKFLAVPVALFAALAFPTHSNAQTAAASTDQDHVVSSQTLQQQVQSTAATRQKNIEVLNELVSTPTAQKAMHDAKIDPQQVKTAIPTLSDHDLANLAARATNAQREFAAGHIGPSLLTLIILLIIVIIVVSIVH